MQLSFLLFAAYACTASATITWTLQLITNPTTDEQDAYTGIADAMLKAVARYHKYSSANRTIRVAYVPGLIPTADGSNIGDIRFGSDRQYMIERVAFHEITHTMGVGTTTAFFTKCLAGDWNTALSLLRSFDGSSANITCVDGHVAPYGLNQPTDWSKTNPDRHVQMVEAMLNDGMWDL